jgi:hypothetical protein
MGYCGGYDRPGFANPPYMGRGGFGNWGAGRGWRHRFSLTGIPDWVPTTPEQEAADLRAQAEWLKTQLDVIQKRIEELTSK